MERGASWGEDDMHKRLSIGEICTRGDEIGGRGEKNGSALWLSIHSGKGGDRGGGWPV